MDDPHHTFYENLRRSYDHGKHEVLEHKNDPVVVLTLLLVAGSSLGFGVKQFEKMNSRISNEQVLALNAALLNKSLEAKLDQESLKPFTEGKLSIHRPLSKEMLIDAGLNKGAVGFVFSGRYTQGKKFSCHVDIRAKQATTFFQIMTKYVPDIVVDKSGMLVGTENPLATPALLQSICQETPKEMSEKPTHKLLDVLTAAFLGDREVPKKELPSPNGEANRR